MVGAGPHKASGEGFSEEMPYCRLQRGRWVQVSHAEAVGNRPLREQPMQRLTGRKPQAGSIL